MNERLSYIIGDQIITSNKLDWITYIKTEKIMKEDVDKALMYCLIKMFDGTILTEEIINKLPTAHVHILINQVSDIYMRINQEILEIKQSNPDKKKLLRTEVAQLLKN